MRVLVLAAFLGLVGCQTSANLDGVTSRQGQESRSQYLSSRYNDDAIEGIATAAANWQPFPRCNERTFWQGLPQQTQDLLRQEGEKYLDYRPEIITASDYRRVVATGDRQTLQKTQRKRRNAMFSMMLAECVEFEGRFVDKIADLIWLIAEESYWGSPAHLNVRDGQAVILPDVSQRFVDLFNADTSRELALVSYFLGDQLDAITPRIRQRIYTEVNNRLFRHAPDKLAEFHASLKAGKRVNNWAGWIGKNWLLCLLLLEQDQQKLQQGIRGALAMLDTYIAGFPDDGSVSEGPGYWRAGAGRLYTAMEMLRQLQPNIDPYDSEFIRNIYEFIAKVHIDGNYFTSNADSGAKVGANPYLLADMAVRLNSPLLADLAVKFPPKTNQLEKVGGFDHFKTRMYELFRRPQLQQVAAIAAQGQSSQDNWLADLQLLVARSHQPHGFTLTAKAGHNDESHNHNDVGVFAIYLHGKPLIVDPGKRTYVLTTFSDKRYEPEHWNHNSWSHNLPVFNGVQQQNGKQYKATGVTTELLPQEASFSAEISQAYPKEAKLSRFNRQLSLLRQQDKINLSDSYELADTAMVELTLMTPAEVKVDAKRSKVRFTLSSGEQADLHYDNKQLNVEIKPMPITDKQMKGSWGQLNQVYFSSKSKVHKANWPFTFELVSADKG